MAGVSRCVVCDASVREVQPPAEWTPFSDRGVVAVLAVAVAGGVLCVSCGSLVQRLDYHQTMAAKLGEVLRSQLRCGSTSTPATTAPPVACPLCAKWLQHDGPSPTVHLLSHLHELQLTCPSCGQRAADWPALRNHALCTHRTNSAQVVQRQRQQQVLDGDAGRYRCPACPRLFSNVGRFCAHLRRHGAVTNTPLSQIREQRRACGENAYDYLEAYETADSGGEDSSCVSDRGGRQTGTASSGTASGTTGTAPTPAASPGAHSDTGTAPTPVSNPDPHSDTGTVPTALSTPAPQSDSGTLPTALSSPVPHGDTGTAPTPVSNSDPHSHTVTTPTAVATPGRHSDSAAVATCGAHSDPQRISPTALRSASDHSCDECGKTFSTKRYLQRHLSRHREEIFVCLRCRQPFADQYALMLHSCVGRTDEPLEVRCSAELESKSDILKTAISTSLDSLNITDSVDNQCVKQETLAIADSVGSHHIAGSADNQSVKPDTVASAGSVEPELTALTCLDPVVVAADAGSTDPATTVGGISTEVVSTAAEHRCTVCSRLFSTSSALSRHSRGHADPAFQCSVCGKCFRWKNNLDVHLRLHAGELPYQCDLCGHATRCSANLRLHKQRVHSDLRPHVCAYCQKAFKERHSLAIHVRSHTGHRPYVCERCGDRFVTKGKLNSHMSKHSEVRAHACPLCGRPLKTSAILSRHCRRVHGGSVSEVTARAALQAAEAAAADGAAAAAVLRPSGEHPPPPPPAEFGHMQYVRVLTTLPNKLA